MDEVAAAQHGGEKSSSPVDPWSISVKTVGGGIHIDENPSGERQFTVRVSPEDRVASLYDQIEASTGLKASQQRLIYRGRLIGLKDLSNNPKIKDIAGLSDGQTIHLVKRRETETPETSADGALSSDSTTSRDAGDGDLLGTGSGSRGLLAALLGLSSGLSDESDEPTTTRRWGLGASRAARSSRRPHHRLTAEDRQVPDPGSLEPVRQGLLTLHTLLPHMPHSHNPLEANREWYRGQWLDVLDTVNQWLEATVVEIMHPHQILPQALDNPSLSDRPRRRPPQIHCDPPVSASDLEGRRHLLLEPCDDENDVHDLGGELAGFRPRSCNQGVQLLLIHYNGWPHRWDEWIRSDSDRLRPFRTRTRHPNVSTTASPTPQSVFHEAPRTNILPHGDDTDDRWAVLPELARAVAAVNEILQQQIVAAPGSHDLRSNLPWASSTPTAPNHPDDLVPPSEGEDTSNIIRPLDNAELDHEDDGSADLAVNLDDMLGMALSGPIRPPTTGSRSQYDQRELFNLATLLDRLGRTLTDAAPHVASLAANLASEQANSAEADELFEEAVEQALEEIADSMPADSDGSAADTSIGGLLSLWSRERRRRNNAVSNSTNADPAIEAPSNTVTTPDIEDYVNGLVNMTRGEVRTGPRSRLASDDVANLLGAYLAAATLGGAASSTGDGDAEEAGTSTGASLGIGQLLRGGTIGGGGSGGIDIHIHAVVTAPGMATGGLGITTLGGGGALTATGIGGTRNLFSTTQRRNSSTTSILRTSRTPSGSLLSSRRRNNPSEDEDDAGIFAELYSETPEPIDPNGSPLPGDQSSSPQSTTSHPTLPHANRTDHSTDYITGLRTSYGGSNTTFRRERETPADFLTRVNQSSTLDPTNVGAATQAGRGVSSTRRRSSRHSFRRETATDDASDTTPPRRGGWGRLFRRRSSRDDPHL